MSLERQGRRESKELVVGNVVAIEVLPQVEWRKSQVRSFCGASERNRHQPRRLRKALNKCLRHLI